MQSEEKAEFPLTRLTAFKLLPEKLQIFTRGVKEQKRGRRKFYAM